MINSVSTEAAAIVGGHPDAFTLASTSFSPSMRTVSFILSRHTSLVTSPMPEGRSSSPTLRGFAMCSATCGLYIFAKFRSETLDAPGRFEFIGGRHRVQPSDGLDQVRYDVIDFLSRSVRAQAEAKTAAHFFAR